jgi:hypothetical protein
MSEASSGDAAAVRLRRRRRGRLGLLQGVWVLLVACVLVVAALSLTGAPLRLPEAIAARVETAVNARLNGAGLRIGTVEMRFGADGRPEVKLVNTTVTDGAGNPLAQLNDVGLGFSPKALAAGRLQPRIIRLSGAQVTLRRDAAGGISVSFGGMGEAAGAATPGEAVAMLDGFFASGPMAEVARIEAADITITLEDARTGRVWQATGGSLEVANGAEGVSITVRSEVFNGTEDLAEVELTYVSGRDSPTARLAARFVDAAAGDIALQSPALAVLGLLDAKISGSMDLGIDRGGGLAGLAAALDIGAGRLRPGPEAAPFEFEGARARVDYDPSSGRITVPELSARTELVSLTADGHLLLGDLRAGWPENVLAQFRIGDLDVAPGAILDGPLAFDAAFADLRVEFEPFALHIGQLTLEGPHGRQEVRGRVGAAPEGWSLALDISSGEAALEDALALWPVPVGRGARSWVAQNVSAGRLTDFTAALRIEPGQRPVTGLSFGFADAEVRAMRHLPPITGAAGVASLVGPRFALALSEGRMADGTGGVADLGGSTFVVPDGNMRPRMAELRLDAAAPLDAVLRILDNPPFAVLGRTARPEALLATRAEARLGAEVRFPIKRGLRPDEVTYTVSGTLSDVAAADLLPGRPLDATRLELNLSPTLFELAGPVSVGALLLDAVYRRGVDPGGGIPAEVSARLSLTAETIAALGVALPPGSVTGAAKADLSLVFAEGGPTLFRLSSDLVGAGVEIAPIGWTKAPGTPGRLAVEGRIEAGATRIDLLDFDAPGLAATGTVDPGSGPGTGILRFDRVQAGAWLDAPVTLEGQGPGLPLAVRIDGGRVDLSQRPPAGGGAGSGPVPLQLSLDRLTISEGLALAPFRGAMSAGDGLSGSFEAQINGGAPVRGTLVPSAGGTAIRVTSSDGGAVLRDAGLYPNARGGDFELILSPQGGPGRYDGQVTIGRTRIANAPGLASLLDAISVVGLLDELEGQGILFDTVDARFEMAPDRVILREAAAVGASLGISMDGVYDVASKRMDMQGVVSPIYLLNGIGQLFTRRGEGLFGFAYRMTGRQGEVRVEVNPLSIFTPAMFRDVFRRPLPAPSEGP